MLYTFKRILAYFLDCLFCYGAVMLVVQWAIFSNIRHLIGIDNQWFQNSVNMESYVLLTISLPVWLYFSYFDSNHTKGTFGKRIMKLSVVNLNQERISFKTALGRTFFKLLPWEIAHLGVIFPTPVYFQEEASVRMLTIIGILLFTLNFVSILILKNNQTIYDKWLRTKVINNTNYTLKLPV